MQALTRHLDEVGESYGEHMAHAGRFGAVMLLAGLACCIHAVLPFLFETTASRLIGRLHAQMHARRHRAEADLGPLVTQGAGI